MVWIQLGPHQLRPAMWAMPSTSMKSHHVWKIDVVLACFAVFLLDTSHYYVCCYWCWPVATSGWPKGNCGKARVFQFPWSDSAVLSMALQQIWKIIWNIDRKTLQILVKFARKVIKMEADPLDNRPCQKRFNTHRMSPQIFKHSLNFTWIQKVTRSQISIPSTGLHPKQMNEPYEGLAAMANYVHFQCQDIIAIGCNSKLILVMFHRTFLRLGRVLSLGRWTSLVGFATRVCSSELHVSRFDDVWWFFSLTCGRESVNGESFAESLLPWRSQAESESLISDRNHALIRSSIGRKKQKNI